MVFLNVLVGINFLITAHLHPFHASVADIEYHQDNKSLEISYRMFIDDLEQTLNRRFEGNLNLLDPAQKSNVDDLVNKYLGENLRFWVNGREVEFVYWGSEMENNAIWTYIEITGITSLEKLEIENSVMLEIFDDQIQLMHVNNGDEVKSMKLYKDHAYGTLDFE
ncbi:MAG: hypothetical protein RJQ09_04165 [Cyclobacteriaceae bacterium]